MVQLDAEAGKQLRNLDSWGQAAVSLSQLAGDASNVAGQLEQVRVAVKVDLQKKVIVEQLRPGLPKLAERARAAEAALAQMIQELTQPDKLTQEKFQQAKFSVSYPFVIK